MSKHWKNTTTWPRRYDHFGATGYALSYARHKGEVVIIDVGCSTGEAMVECKKCLAQHGIRVREIGIDSSEKVAAASEKNLDKFIQRNVLNVNEYEKTADIVLCMNMERFIDWDNRSEIIEKCSWFLKDDGMLITGISKKHQKRLKLEQPISTIPDMVCVGDSWKTWVVDLQRRVCIKDTRMMPRSEALHYADMLLSDWQKADTLRRLYMKYLLTIL